MPAIILWVFLSAWAIPGTKRFETELSKIIEWVVTFASLLSFRSFVLIFNNILIFNVARALDKLVILDPLVRWREAARLMG